MNGELVARMHSEDQWTAILALGERVDARLDAGDVRLTMGGEPTFISAEDPSAAEWRTAALGPTKVPLAAQLVRRLRERFAPGGVIHFGEGKWYPGEPLPRWAFTLCWRKDGKALWQDPGLLALSPSDDPASVADPGCFMTLLAARLGLETDFVHPAYEDPVPYLARERCLPDNVDLLRATLSDEETYGGLVRVLNHGLDLPVASVLPLQWSDTGATAGWRSERWSFKRKRLYLVPGDHPAGHRMPFGSLPVLPPDLYPYYNPVDPFDDPPPLAEPERAEDAAGAAVPPDHLSEGEPPAFPGPRKRDAPARRAICAEPRDGLLNVFLPSMDSADAFAALLFAIEATAAELGAPVRLEGYAPPFDPRLKSLSVTPDPGVIEVNLHPAGGWRELVNINMGLFEDARRSGLTTEKFTPGGRYVGTGGGNHITIGGPRPADSPFLRRPDLLRSVICYWQHHPALSYLFSGLFVGPSSQAPRVDEARHEALDELELAFRQVPDPASNEGVQPWLVDRLFRNLLIDVSGNTHRAELCIDKLYSPDSVQGRLGLLELRAFEMPRDARLLLAQRLLIRALIAWFWERPFDRPLARWGATLHDDFMLPHFVWSDLLAVTEDLAGAGIDFDPEWLRVQFELRFPCYGRVIVDGVSIEVRQALEPWLVLGEEPDIGGTSRTTDSSMDRLQVGVSGFDAVRHELTCNGRPVPLHPVHSVCGDGAHVAGVRFRAWDNPCGLHPTLGATPTLRFALFDKLSDRSLGGCVYSVDGFGEEEGRPPPVDARQAKQRRRSRFRPLGPSTANEMPPAVPAATPGSVTLDLRWVAEPMRRG